MEPADLLVGAEPGELAFGQVTGIPLHKRNGLLQPHHAAQVETHMTVADALHGFEIQAVTTVYEPSNLLHETIGNHLLTAAIDKAIQVFALAVQPHFEDLKWAFFKTMLPLPLAHPLAPHLEELQGGAPPRPVSPGWTLGAG